MSQVQSDLVDALTQLNDKESELERLKESQAEGQDTDTDK